MASMAAATLRRQGNHASHDNANKPGLAGVFMLVAVWRPEPCNHSALDCSSSAGFGFPGPHFGGSSASGFLVLGAQFFGQLPGNP